jgi:hypothetical protein
MRAAPVFAAILRPTDPFPVPDPPDVIVSHVGALLVAVQVHAAVVVTVTDAVFAFASTL